MRRVTLPRVQDVHKSGRRSIRLHTEIFSGLNLGEAGRRLVYRLTSTAVLQELLKSPVPACRLWKTTGP